jgi:hypothetical protein
MKQSLLEMLGEGPLRMAGESEPLPPPLLNWPPEKVHQMPKFKSRKRPAIVTCVILFGMAVYFYLKLHV